MKRSLILVFLLIAFGANSQGSDQIYSQRRERLMNSLDTTCVFAMKAADSPVDDYNPYQQDNDFLYLTGIKEPGYMMIMIPGGIIFGENRKYCLFFSPTWDWDKQVTLTTKDTLLPAGDFERILKSAIKGKKTLFYTPVSPASHDWINGKVYMAEREMKKQFVKDNPGMTLKPGAMKIAPFRQIKSENEIEFTRKAIEMTVKGLKDAYRYCKPGMKEYELQALIEYQATRNGSKGMGFFSIIGSGENSLEPHYYKNDRQMEAGDLVVMDVGARDEGYCADITRTIPVSGKFNDKQAVVYQAVLDIQKKLIGMVKPGMTVSQVEKAGYRLTQDAGYGDYYLHGVSHPIGLNVHDPFVLDTLKPGMILTIEPGIYIPGNDTLQPEGRTGFGIRIEDDVLVTKDGCEVLSASVPKEIAEIEKMMKHTDQKRSRN
jgi:Xaa-Pro aminopeptidase